MSKDSILKMNVCGTCLSHEEPEYRNAAYFHNFAYLSQRRPVESHLLSSYIALSWHWTLLGQLYPVLEAIQSISLIRKIRIYYKLQISLNICFFNSNYNYVLIRIKQVEFGGETNEKQTLRMGINWSTFCFKIKLTKIFKFLLNTKSKLPKVEYSTITLF